MLVLICFFTFQTFYACFTTSATFIDRGYSTFSFIGLYLLARYIRLYGKAIIKKAELLSLIAFGVGISSSKVRRYENLLYVDVVHKPL